MFPAQEQPPRQGFGGRSGDLAGAILIVPTPTPFPRQGATPPGEAQTVGPERQTGVAALRSLAASARRASPFGGPGVPRLAGTFRLPSVTLSESRCLGTSRTGLAVVSVTLSAAEWVWPLSWPFVPHSAFRIPHSIGSRRSLRCRRPSVTLSAAEWVWPLSWPFVPHSAFRIPHSNGSRRWLRFVLLHNTYVKSPFAETPENALFGVRIGVFGPSGAIGPFFVKIGNAKLSPFSSFFVLFHRFSSFLLFLDPFLRRFQGDKIDVSHPCQNGRPTRRPHRPEKLLEL